MIRESNEVRKPFFLVRGAPNSFHRVTRLTPCFQLFEPEKFDESDRRRFTAASRSDQAPDATDDGREKRGWLGHGRYSIRQVKALDLRVPSSGASTGGVKGSCQGKVTRNSAEELDGHVTPRGCDISQRGAVVKQIRIGLGVAGRAGAS